MVKRGARAYTLHTCCIYTKGILAHWLVGVRIFPHQRAALHREDIAPDPGVGRYHVATKAHILGKTARGRLSCDRQQPHGLLHGSAVVKLNI